MSNAASTQTAATEHAHCTRCGRKLTSAASIAAGYGRGCLARIRAAAKAADLSAFTAAQVAQARELIEDGAIVADAQPGWFLAVSTDGDAIYLATAGFCTCPASKPCYHQAAIIILAAA